MSQRRKSSRLGAVLAAANGVISSDAPYSGQVSNRTSTINTEP
jgi:hypothetical protein